MQACEQDCLLCAQASICARYIVFGSLGILAAAGMRCLAPSSLPHFLLVVLICRCMIGLMLAAHVLTLACCVRSLSAAISGEGGGDLEAGHPGAAAHHPRHCGVHAGTPTASCGVACLIRLAICSLFCPP